jgi:FlaA1/EpsC-like NDP-sugar epimerase
MIHPAATLASTRRLLERALSAAVTPLCLMAAIVLSYALRFEGLLDDKALESLRWALVLVPPIQWAVLVVFAERSRSLRGLALRDLWRIVFGVLAGLAVAACVATVAGLRIPRSIWVIDWFVATSILGGLRGLGCELKDLLARRGGGTAPRVLLVGSGPSIDGVVRALASDAFDGRPRRLAGILARPEESDLVGRSVLGVPVIGTTRSIATTIAARRINEVLLLSESLVGAEVRRLRDHCREAGCELHVIPAIETLLRGSVHVQPRNVEIADLLRRDAVSIDTAGIGRWLCGRTVLVTGASGSIGSELCRQLVLLGPKRLVVLDRSETGLFWLERELERLDHDVEIHPCVADLNDPERVDEVLASERPSIIFHAAAYKHVPLMERHPGEAVKNISLATSRLAAAAARHEVESFVLVSTDKAVNPTSVMGCCKRLAEILVRLTSEASATRFTTVRFGNVLDSAGSVVPIFREQILRGGPVTVTHPDIERYFMTIPEAARLVVQAGAIGAGGEVFVLDMGDPVRIVDLARDMIRLSDLVEGRDIEIRFTGLRPGEKLFEELFESREELLETAHPKIHAARLALPAGLRLPEILERLEQAVGLEPDGVRRTLKSLVPEYAWQADDQPHPAAGSLRINPATLDDAPLPDPAVRPVRSDSRAA